MDHLLYWVEIVKLNERALQVVVAAVAVLCEVLLQTKISLMLAQFVIDVIGVEAAALLGPFLA